MRTTKSNPEIEREIDVLYYKIGELIKERGITWSKLAALCGLNRRTLTSMKAQRINPSWTTMIRIAKALDVSLDELTETKGKTPELLEFYWAVPRILTDPDTQGMMCKAALLMVYTSSETFNDEKVIRHRESICRDEIKEKYRNLKQKDEDSDDDTESDASET